MPFPPQDAPELRARAVGYDQARAQDNSKGPCDPVKRTVATRSPLRSTPTARPVTARAPTPSALLRELFVEDGTGRGTAEPG